MGKKSEPHAAENPLPLQEYQSRFENYVRRDPARTTAIALAIGFAFSVLPLARLVRGLVYLALQILRPALIVLGALKLFEEWKRCCGCGGKNEE